MFDILAQIEEMSDEDRHDLLTILTLKYVDLVGKALLCRHWPSRLEAESERVRNYFKIGT